MKELIELTPEAQRLLRVQKAINGLPPAKREACVELADHFRVSMRRAGLPVGRLALDLVVSEIDAE